MKFGNYLLSRGHLFSTILVVEGIPREVQPQWLSLKTSELIEKGRSMPVIQGNYGNGVHLNTVESVYPRLCTTLSDTVGISQQLRKGSGGSMMRLALQIINTSSVY